MTTAPYLPKVATLEQAQGWLEHETGQQWPLARLIEETAIMPWVWLDYSPEYAEIFAGRTEGYLAPMLFAGDTQRLAAGADDVVITMTETADGRLLQMAGMRCPLAALRFIADDVRENAKIATASTKGETPYAISSGAPIGQIEKAAHEGSIRARREAHDITTERGCRRRILELWPTIEALHANPDGHQVRRVIMRNIDKSENPPALKTVQNKLCELRADKLIP